MCLYPKRIKNKKYLATKKNEKVMPITLITGDPVIYNDIPVMVDPRCEYIDLPCGNCIECRKKKASAWMVRLNEEIKDHKYNYFITLTFSPEGLEEAAKACIKDGIIVGIDIEKNISLKITDIKDGCNLAATKAVRRSLERWRKDHHVSIKHWYVTELGHEGTERIHLHGLLLSDEPIEFEKIERMEDGWWCNWKYWKYGRVFVGDYVNTKTVNYIVKYITKIDLEHKNFNSIILCSPGIAKNWIERHKTDLTYKYIKGRTRTDVLIQNGQRMPMPTYFRNKLYTEDERELIWRDFMDKEKLSVMGVEHSFKEVTQRQMEKITGKAKERNFEFGFGDDSKEWKKTGQNITLKMLKSHHKKEFAKKLYKNL